MGITTTFLVVVMFLLLSPSCSGDKAEVVEVQFDPENTYTMRTTDATSLFSDSGITRYRMKAKEMLVFDKAAEPYLYFPEGLYVEQFDTLFNVQGSFKADTVYNWNKKRLWKAIGNVEVENLQGERFETDLLYWDQVSKRVYSDAYMRIEREDRIITGIGFESTEDMSEYQIYNPQGSFPVNQESTDTTKQAPETEPSQTAPLFPQKPTLPRRSSTPVAVVDTLQVEPQEPQESQ